MDDNGKKTLRVLIVEDSEDDALLLVRQLRRGGYELDFVLVATGEEMTQALDRQAWDFVISDFSLPHFGGLAALDLVKTRGLDVPFIIVSGVIGEETAVEAMKAGAHDYLMKGNLARLIPAIERELREAEVRTERKKAQEQILESLREKEVLLKEIHHRVKNNLQVIVSLLNLQSGYIKDRQALDMFKECQNRVKSMAIIHEVLYQSKDLARVNFREYVRSLAANLFRAFGVNKANVGLDLRVESVALEIDTAIPCGLIINELVSNALKYAFPDGRHGTVTVDIHADPDGQLILAVADDGVGLPPAIDFRNTQSLGLQLVNMLTDQLAGRIELDNSRGTQFAIAFPGHKTERKELSHVGSTHSRG